MSNVMLRMEGIRIKTPLEWICAFSRRSYFHQGSNLWHAHLQSLQVLLRVGIVRSRRAPTTRHPYGYLKDKFVWSLVSAVGIFCLGAGITTAHGVSSLLAGPQALENLGYGMTGDQA